MKLKVGDTVFFTNLKGNGRSNCWAHRWEVFQGVVYYIEGSRCSFKVFIDGEEVRVIKHKNGVFFKYEDALDYCREANNISINDSKATIKRLIEDINYTLSYDGEVNA